MERIVRRNLQSLFARLTERVRARPDTEFQQSLIRFAIGLVFFIYYIGPWFSHDPASVRVVSRVASVFLPVSIILLLASLIDTKVSVFRRILGAIVDF